MTEFADRELDVMAVLWERGPSTVAEVRKELEDDLAYTTVLTVLRTLEEKGHVDHRSAGRAHVYRPLVERAAAQRSHLQRVVDRVFRGSREQLLAHLVEDEDLSETEIRRMRELLAERLGEEIP